MRRGTYNSAKNRCEADPYCPSNPEGLTLSGNVCVKTAAKSTRLECKNMTPCALCAARVRSVLLCRGQLSKR